MTLTTKKIYRLMSLNQLISELIRLENGCENKVDYNGYCWYISIRGNKRYCSTCTRKFQIGKQVLEEKYENRKKTENRVFRK